MTLAWNHGVVIMELNSSWKWVVLIKLQLIYNELHSIYNELQFKNWVARSIAKHPFFIVYNEAREEAITLEDHILATGLKYADLDKEQKEISE
jgi:hypothetical protein